jgi:flagellar basal body-associated protein FliL
MKTKKASMLLWILLGVLGIALIGILYMVFFINGDISPINSIASNIPQPPALPA